MASARLVSCEWSNLVFWWRRLTHSTQDLQMCTFVFFKIHFAYYTIHGTVQYYTWHTLLIVQSTYCTVCTLCNAQTVSHKCAMCLMQNVLCTMCHVPLCFVPRAMYHCALYHVPCTECALYRSLTLDNGPSVSRSALLIEFLHRGHFPNEGTAKNK